MRTPASQVELVRRRAAERQEELAKRRRAELRAAAQAQFEELRLHRQQRELARQRQSSPSHASSPREAEVCNAGSGNGRSARYNDGHGIAAEAQPKQAAAGTVVVSHARKTDTKDSALAAE